MLDILDSILLTIKAANNKISGRTAIQKLIYFESIFGLVDVKYRPYYYGPYSSELMGTIEMAISLKFIKEDIDVLSKNASNTIEWKKYEYCLTNDGIELSNQLLKKHRSEYESIKEIVSTCNDISQLNVNTLSYAAKINYILVSKKKSMTCDEIADTANSYGWKLSKPEIEEAKALLKALHLCKVS